MKLIKLSKIIVAISCLPAVYSCNSNAKDALPPVAELQLDNNNVELTVGAKTTVKIVSGNGSYKVSTSPAGIVEIMEKENEIGITGVKKGSATITVTDGRGKSATIAAGVVEKKPLFREDFNGTAIDEKTWIIGTWYEHGGQLARERCFVEDGYLNLLLLNDNGKILSSAIQTRAEFLHGKWEARLKPSSVPGVLNSFYTIDWGENADGTKQEIDIEFLTYTFGTNKGKVHFAVHAEGKKSFNLNPDIELGFDPSADFHVWGFNITPSQIEWFVDGKTLYIYKYAGNDVKIDTPYQLKLNHWTQADWINGPPKSRVMCKYLVDWIQFTPAD
ncbi:MAG: family 16 glycosylhydrolase [Niabella sp.]